MKGNSLKEMVSKIMMLVARIFPPDPKPHVGENDEIIVNERMAVACRVIKDTDGYFSVFRFDQLTNVELPHGDQRFPDRDMAISAARKLALFDSPALSTSFSGAGETRVSQLKANLRRLYCYIQP